MKSKTEKVTAALLRKWPLPNPSPSDDKDARGRVFILGGSVGMPGAVILSATAALRAGAGKLLIACPKSIATSLAPVLPESRVIALPEKGEAISTVGLAKRIAPGVSSNAVLIGPGMNENGLSDFISKVQSTVRKATFVLDAAAIGFFKKNSSGGLGSETAIITPHAGEMADLLGISKERVLADASSICKEVAREKKLIVVLKGSETFISSPDGESFVCREGCVGLATSGSGDTLSGIVTGLAARGAEPLQSAVWGVYLHSIAGQRLAKRIGTIGFLARELLDEIPMAMDDFS